MAQVSPIVDVTHARTGGATGYALADDVVLVNVEDGTSRLLDMEGRFYGLPATSTTMLNRILLDGPDEAAQAIAEQCGVALTRVKTDLDHFLDDLVERGLIVNLDGRVPQRSCRDAFGGRVILMMARLFQFTLRRRPTAWAWVLMTLTRISMKSLGWSRTLAFIRALTTSGPNQPCPGEWADTVASVDRIMRRVASGHILLLECKERA